MAKTVAEMLHVAGQRAILRDQESMRRHSPDLALVDEQEQRAQSLSPRHTIVRVPDKSKASFTQILQENYYELQKSGLLSTSERALILDLVPFVELNSNFLIIDHRTSKLSELAKAISYNPKWLSKLINLLVRKGVLYEIVDPEQYREFGRVVSERPFIVNPEIVVSADKNNINLTLCRIHFLYEKLEKKYGIKLPWKIWFAPGLRYGRLYRRETWQKKVKAPPGEKMI